MAEGEEDAEEDAVDEALDDDKWNTMWWTTGNIQSISLYDDDPL